MIDRQKPAVSPANRAVQTAGPLPVGARVVIPQQMRRVRFVAPKTLSTPSGEVPLIHPDDPDSRQIQDHYLAEARVFNLSDPLDLADYNRVWQDITDGISLLSAEDVKFSELHGHFVAFLRWVDVEPALPGQPRPARRHRPIEAGQKEG
jgi:hypothetical protein